MIQTLLTSFLRPFTVLVSAFEPGFERQWLPILNKLLHRLWQLFDLVWQQLQLPSHQLQRRFRIMWLYISVWKWSTSGISGNERHSDPWRCVHRHRPIRHGLPRVRRLYPAQH